MSVKQKIFRKLRIFGVMVPVLKIPGLLGGQGMFGFYDHEARVIGVDEALRGVELEATVVHEMFHAVFARLHIAQQLDDAFAEVVIENLSVALLENFDIKPK